MNMIRGIVKEVVQGIIQRISAYGRSDALGGREEILDREFFQHYGYTSRPLPEAEVLFIREGNNIIVVGSDDRRYRIALEPGEVALYTDEGDKIHLRRERIIEIVGGKKVLATTEAAEINASVSAKINTDMAEITATTSATVTSPLVKLVAQTKVEITSPLTTMSGNLVVTGNITGANVTGVGVVADAGGTKTMSAMRATFNAHTHAEHGTGAGITSAPAAGM